MSCVLLPASCVQCPASSVRSVTAEVSKIMSPDFMQIFCYVRSLCAKSYGGTTCYT